MERVQEYTKLPQEPAEFVEPRPSASWPSEGAIKCENLDIRYAVRYRRDYFALDCINVAHTVARPTKRLA